MIPSPSYLQRSFPYLLIFCLHSHPMETLLPVGHRSLAFPQLGTRPLFPSVFTHLQFSLSLLFFSPRVPSSPYIYGLMAPNTPAQWAAPMKTKNKTKPKTTPRPGFEFHQRGALRSLGHHGISLGLGFLSWETEPEPMSKVYKDQTRSWVWSCS